MTCEEAVAKIEKRFLEKLSFNDLLSLKVHLLMCKNCSIYLTYSKMIELHTPHSLNNHNIRSVKLTDEEKLKMKQVIQQRLANKDNHQRDPI